MSDHRQLVRYYWLLSIIIVSLYIVTISHVLLSASTQLAIIHVKHHLTSVQSSISSECYSNQPLPDHSFDILSYLPSLSSSLPIIHSLHSPSIYSTPKYCPTSIYHDYSYLLLSTHQNPSIYNSSATWITPHVDPRGSTCTTRSRPIATR